MTGLQKVSSLVLASTFAVSALSPIIASADTVDTLNGDAHLVVNSNGGADPTPRPDNHGQILMTGVPSFDFGTHNVGKLNDDATFTINAKAATGTAAGTKRADPAKDTAMTLNVNDLRPDANAWSITAEVGDLSSANKGTVGLDSFKMTVADNADSHVTGATSVDIHGAAAKVASHDTTEKSVYDETSGATSASMTLPADIVTGDYHANITYTLSDAE